MLNPRDDIYTVVKRYADAWVANDMATIIDSYHDDVVFHYFGHSSLAGVHRGKPACLAILKQVRDKTRRRLLEIRDVLAGTHFGLIIAVEQFEHRGSIVDVERILRYSVRDGKLAECWIYDEDQQLVDECFS